MIRNFKGRAIIPGEVEGHTIVSQEPLSFWGGVDPSTGKVIDKRHDCFGKYITGKIFVFPTGKGSSTASAVLMECVRNSKGPKAIINSKLDPILALGAIIVEVLYNKTIPIIVLDHKDLLEIQENELLLIKSDGTISIENGN